MTCTCQILPKLDHHVQSPISTGSLLPEDRLLFVIIEEDVYNRNPLQIWM